MAVLSWFENWFGTRSSSQHEVYDISDLAAIREENVNLVYWKRPVDPDMEWFVQQICRDGFPALNVPVDRHEVRSVVAHHFAKVGVESFGKTKLEKDVVHITQQFMDVVNSDRLRLIMKVVTDDACRKFHTDAYDLRLLCTYAGRGTEWIADAWTNRRKLIDGDNNDIVRDWTKVQRLEPFEVAILKGEPAGRPTGGIVHRSPPIEQSGEKRFLLRLDY
ncbi:MAG: DUF1826 domain-containing protein [Bacteroidota bacterium]